MNDASETTEPKSEEPSQTEAELPTPDAVAAPEKGTEVTTAIAPDEPRLMAPAYSAKKIADPNNERPSRAFLLVVATISLFSDIASKLWAEKALEGYPGFVSVVDEHLMFILAKNKGGAWGLLQGQNENVRRPFFLLVSVAAIAFIMTLYRRLTPRQHALRWGLPLVLGGALGNVFDRVRYGHVIDFIDYRAEWVRSMNAFIAKKVEGHYVTDHWPTFNVADVAICVGVGLMAVDMFTARRGKSEVAPGGVVAAGVAPSAVLVTESGPSPGPEAESESAPESGSTSGSMSEGASEGADESVAEEAKKETA